MWSRLGSGWRPLTSLVTEWGLGVRFAIVPSPLRAVCFSPGQRVVRQLHNTGDSFPIPTWSFLAKKKVFGVSSTATNNNPSSLCLSCHAAGFLWSERSAKALGMFSRLPVCLGLGSRTWFGWAGTPSPQVLIPSPLPRCVALWIRASLPMDFVNCHLLMQIYLFLH